MPLGCTRRESGWRRSQKRSTSSKHRSPSKRFIRKSVTLRRRCSELTCTLLLTKLLKPVIRTNVFFTFGLSSFTTGPRYANPRLRHLRFFGLYTHPIPIVYKLSSVFFNAFCELCLPSSTPSFSSAFVRRSSPPRTQLSDERAKAEPGDW